jgi:hypothetical protein
MTDKKISIEQMNKESEDLTKVELENLLNHISNNPTLLKPKRIIEYESDSGSTTPSSYSSSSADDNVEIYKKDTKIDELDRKLYYKNLHLTNVTLENTKLVKENEDLKKMLKDGELVTSIIKSMSDFSIEKTEEFTIDNVFSYKITIETQFKFYKNQLELINNRISNIPDEKVRTYFENEIAKMNKRLDEINKVNNTTINDFINHQKITSRITNLMFMFLGGILLLLIKEFFSIYNINL